MTKYLKNYISSVEEKLLNCSSLSELEKIFNEHKDKIQFMQHERLVHFLVTFMFAVILVMFIGIQLLTENAVMLILILIIIALLAAYIQHYYFLENTVQYMYKIYDRIIEKQKELEKEAIIDDKAKNS